MAKEKSHQIIINGDVGPGTNLVMGDGNQVPEGRIEHEFNSSRQYFLFEDRERNISFVRRRGSLRVNGFDGNNWDHMFDDVERLKAKSEGEPKGEDGGGGYKWKFKFSDGVKVVIHTEERMIRVFQGDEQLYPEPAPVDAPAEQQ